MASSMRIGILLGSIRDQQRATEPVAKFIHELATQREGQATYELVDLKTFDVPLLTTHIRPAAANGTYDDPNVQRWSDRIKNFDGYVFVTPEYNHGVPGGFKNAFDTLAVEWIGKPVAFAAHGSASGVRAIEQWRQIVVNFSMLVVRPELQFNAFVHWDSDEFLPEERHAAEAHLMLEELENLISLTKRD